MEICKKKISMVLMQSLEATKNAVNLFFSSFYKCGAYACDNWSRCCLAALAKVAKKKKRKENPAWRLQQVHADTSSLWPWQTICFDPPNEPNHHVL
jgi:hypothetical protein